MPSLMNGLSSLGSGVAQFAGQAGLDAQKGILAQQQAILADQLATTRETTLEGQRQTFQTGLEGQRQTFQSGENTKSQTAEMARTQATIAGSAANNAASNASATERTRMEVEKPTGELQMARALAGPGATQEQLQDALQTVLSGRAKYTSMPATQADPNDPNKVISGVNVFNTRTGESEFQATGTTPNRGGSSGATLSSDTQDQIADRLLTGDTSAMTGLGFGNTGSANRAAVQERVTAKLKAKGLTGADLAAAVVSFSGEKAGARSGGTREANVSMAVNEAKLFMPLALAASDKVDRSMFPSLNGIIQSAEKGTGDENVVRLAVATNSLVNAYSRAITPSGVPTEGNQSRARELLDKAWTKGQYSAAVDQLWQEMAAAQKSPVQTQEEQRARISGRPSADATAPSAAAPSAAKPASPAPAGIPSWVKPGDQYSPSRGQARGADGTVYGSP